MQKKLKPFKGTVEFDLYKNGVQVKTKNRRTILEQKEDDPDFVILMMKDLVPKGMTFPSGEPISTIETFERGILSVSIGMSTSSLQTLHAAIGHYLHEIGVHPIPTFIPSKTE